jgi:CitMHS family citrate-Mg2+:H+ or citrate-Ca2+:H+ symporter
MVAALGFITIIVLLAVIMTKKMSPLVALIGGHGLNIGKYINDGVKSIAPTGTMFIFAILFFGILTDAGTFQPIIDKILKVVGKDPIKIAIGTAILSMIVHLDGSGAVTFLVTVPAMLPLYEALGMRKTTLATIVALGAGVMNILPWGGPTIRAATSLKIPVTELFNPLLIPVLTGIIFVLFVAFKLGRDEKVRIGNIEEIEIDTNNLGEKKKSRNFVVNILTIIVAIVVLVSGKLSPTVVFMIAFCISIVICKRTKRKSRCSCKGSSHDGEYIICSRSIYWNYAKIWNDNRDVYSYSKNNSSIIGKLYGSHYRGNQYASKFTV